MKHETPRTTRRAFFVRGGAVLGAGVAVGTRALAGGASGAPTPGAADREALRDLHAQFLRTVATGDFAAATALFTAHARLELSSPIVIGARAIGEFFATHYASGEAPVRHAAYRRTATQPEDVIRLHDDGMHATATFATEAELCTPLAATCTAAQMARLQGNVAERRWQPGRFDARYVRSARGWRIAELRWSAA